MVQAVFEMLFDLAYFVTALTVGIILVKKGKSTYLKLFGIMAIVLASGDSFHLVPRVYSLFTNTMEQNAFYLGLGQMITSVTMTIFYVILYFIWELRAGRKSTPLRVSIFGLALVRIILCFLPQNEWFISDAPVLWGIIRNIPFAIMGIIIIVLCFIRYKEANDKDYLQMGIAVILSFGFYIPVVIWANTVPMIGMLMIPKTLAYVWVVMIGFMEYKREIKANKTSENNVAVKDVVLDVPNEETGEIISEETAENESENVNDGNID